MSALRHLALAAAVAAAGLASRTASACDGGDGRFWLRQPVAQGMTWDQLAALCPLGGAGPCTGALAGLTWANADEVLGLFGCFAPELTARTCAAGVENLGAASTAVGALGANYTYATSFSMTQSSEGWVSTREASGAPMLGQAFTSVGVNQSGGYAIGTLGVGISTLAADAGSPYRGAWLYRRDGGSFAIPVVSCVAPMVDAGADAGASDGGRADAGTADAGAADAGAADAGRSDGGVADAGAPDGGETPGRAGPVHLGVGCSSGAEAPCAVLLLLLAFARLGKSIRRGVRESRPCELDDSPS